jgi:hypothetical protein
LDANGAKASAQSRVANWGRAHSDPTASIGVGDGDAVTALEILLLAQASLMVVPARRTQRS